MQQHSQEPREEGMKSTIKYQTLLDDLFLSFFIFFNIFKKLQEIAAIARGLAGC